MGGSISALAFPAPDLPMDWYEAELLRRPDLVWLTTSHNERIPAIHIRHDPEGDGSQSSSQQAERLTIIYSHGNAEDISLHLPLISALADVTGCDVLSYEYVGYALSKVQEGHSASEAGCIRSIQCAWRYLVDQRRVPPNSVVIYGRSIGSGPSVDLASRAVIEGTAHSPLDARGVLLQSPISSGARAILGKAASVVGYPLDIFKNYMKIGKIQAPVAIAHGTVDEVVPCENGRALHEQCQQPFEPLWLEGRGHNDIPQDEMLEYARLFVSALRARGSALPAAAGASRRGAVASAGTTSGA